MGDASKILSLFALGDHVAEHYAMRRLFAKLALMLTLTVAMGIMMGVLLGCALYAGYLILMAQGISQGAALLVVALAAFFLAITFLYAVYYHVGRVSRSIGNPIVNKIRPIVDAFIDGLMTKPVQAKGGRYD